MSSVSLDRIRQASFPTERIRQVGGLLRDDKELLLYALILALVVFMGVFGPTIAPYDPDATQYAPDGTVLRAESPSIAHPLGTTHIGQDVLSRLLIGARPTAITGLFGGFLIITIGTVVGVTAGYVGGWVENILMRITDFVYGVPLIPFAIVLLAFMGFGLLTSILALGLILWRGSARVLRSQVLQIKERPFILAAKATGMSTRKIITTHILPNIAPMMLLYFSLGIGYSILVQAGLAFIGISNPFVPSWGVMIRNAYNSGYVQEAWWWTLPPGLMITLTVLAAFMFGRKYEELTSGESDESSLAMGG
jgi:peptide/nickel transport system permease protein